jgi:hypothetical protein
MKEAYSEDAESYSNSISLLEEPGRDTLQFVRIGKAKQCCRIPLILAGAVMGSVLTMLVTVHQPMSLRPYEPTGARQEPLLAPAAISCGDNPDTARSLNCSFDLLSFSWLPSQCYDSELTSQFLQRYNWTWYRSKTPEDSSTSQASPVSQTVALLGNETELYVSDEYHIVHCIYMWKKLHRGIVVEREGLEPGSASVAWIDSYIGNFGHTDHCASYLLNWESTVHASRHSVLHHRRENEHAGHTAGIGKDLDRITTTIRTKYPRCPSHVVLPSESQRWDGIL